MTRLQLMLDGFMMTVALTKEDEECLRLFAQWLDWCRLSKIEASTVGSALITSYLRLAISNGQSRERALEQLGVFYDMVAEDLEKTPC